MRDGLLDQVKSKAYWRMNFRPKSLPEPQLSLPQCNDIVDRSKVSLRGWNYPHISSRKADDSGYGPIDSYYEHWIAWSEHIEFWRMYRTSQFLHYRAVREDWEDWESYPPASRPPEGGLSVVGIIWHWTEVFEFAFRLYKNGLYESGLELHLSLENAKGRQLWINEFNRMPFSYERVTGATSIRYEIALGSDDLASASHEVYLDELVDFFQHFDWTPNKDMLRKDQNRLLTRSY